MLYKFKQSVHLEGKTYKLGVHEVPEEVEKHPYFLTLVKDGSVLEADPEKLPDSPETTLERSKRLHEKLSGKAPKAEEPARDPKHPINVVEDREKAEFGKAESEDESEDKSDKKKKKAKG